MSPIGADLELVTQAGWDGADWASADASEKVRFGRHATHGRVQARPGDTGKPFSRIRRSGRSTA